MVIAKSKKVKPQQNMNTIKNNMDYNWTPAPDPSNNQEASVPKAVFIPHANSLPFEERRVTLEQPVKIGRNVYRATPSSTNTIFECRVLSRHHATLYYDKGHFYLVDNQSSNGTFINNNQCSISKDQEPHEVFSGDVVQFGIPVVENASNSEKNTFPPVVAQLKLFHPDGKEAKLCFNPTMNTPLHLKELYQLNNYVQEAIQREASLEWRLGMLRESVERARAEAQAAWELFVGEQRLLMRVHTLESVLAAGGQPAAHQVAQLLNDKRNYQEVAQESLRTAHEQRLLLEGKLERRGREVAALCNHNRALRLAANNALAELQKLASRCERKMCAARLAIATAEERERALRTHLPLAYSVQNGEAKMLVVSSDSNKLQDSKWTGTLEDAVRALPDYIKLLLPQHLLNKVGIKAVSADGKSSKEFELILQKNNVYNNTESKEKQQTEQEDATESSLAEKSGEPDLCTDDEKQSRLNHEPGHELESTSPLDGELRPDNNANSTYSDQEIREDSPSKAGVEYANVLRVMAGLNDEIKALRERLAAAGGENEQLRAARDQLLAAAADPPPGAPAGDDAAGYCARIADLEALLSQSSVGEESNLAEIQRLAASAAGLQAELAFRPTRADIDDLSAVVGELRQELRAKDEQLERLRAGITKERRVSDKCVETSRSFEDLRRAIEAPPTEAPPTVAPPTEALDTANISAEIDEIFRLDYDEEDDETDSVATEINREDSEPPDTMTSTNEYVRLDDDQRLQVTMQNGTLHALEEELVRAKERWEEGCAERARLAAQLAALQQKRTLTLPRAAHLLAFAVPVLLAALYYVLLPYVS